MDLTPIGEPPSPGARWCPHCCVWWHRHRAARRRCPARRTAVVRTMPTRKPKPGELRPGIIAEFDDPRDRYDATSLLTKLRARLRE